MEPFVRYAARTGALPNRFMTWACDQRMLYILKGRGVLETKEQTYPLRAGTLAFYPAGTAYYPHSEGDVPLEFVTVNFDFYQDFSQITYPVFPLPLESFSERKLLKCRGETPEAFQSVHVLEHMQFLERYFLELAEEYGKKLVYHQQTGSAILSYILCQTARRLALGDEQGGREEGILEWIRANCGEKIDYASISEKFHYHPHHINKIVKKLTGQSLHQYLMECRLKKAVGMLQQTRLPVGEIARACGFPNKDHFSAYFKKCMGMTATQYRSRFTV